MLHTDYSYCFLDFETTGLSHERDDIIQVGLIVTDSKLRIIDYFCSYINPWYEIDKLKTIVSYTTGITPEQILSWITLDEFRSKMSELIPQNVVFVWHNIGFDIGFLKKYLASSILWTSNAELRIDTMDWSKALIHYPASYSLDVLYPIVREQLWSDYFKSISEKVGLQDIQNHDALSDCLICMGLIYYGLKKIEGICNTYPIAYQIINKSPFWFLSLDHHASSVWWVTSSKIPLLDFPSKPESSKLHDTSVDWANLVDASKLYYGNILIEQLIRKLSGLGKYIICTNSRSKLMMIKAKCKILNLHNISFMKEQQGVNKDRLNAIYTKPVLDTWEWWFFLKYCSHAIQWLGLLHLNTPSDYKIYNFIRQDESSQKSDIVLATHSALFSLLEDKEYEDYTIIFLDYERWYNSYLKYISTGYDVSNFARVVDNYVYMVNNLKDEEMSVILKELMNTIDIFCGVRSMEIKNIIQDKKPKNDSFEIGVIQDNHDFPKSNQLLIKINERFTHHENILKDNQNMHKHWDVLQSQHRKLEFYMNSIIKVTPIISDYISYTINIANNFVEYNEFINLFTNYKHYFLSNRNETRQPIEAKKAESAEKAKNGLGILELKDIEQISNKELWNKVYILNNNPTKAKKIFEYLMNNKPSNPHKVLVENVTWWRWKVVAVSKTATQRIIVGGYEMLLQCIQEKITPDQLFVCGDLGLLHKQIVQDISYWLG